MLGIALRAVYDLFRIRRRLMGEDRFPLLRGAEDLIYWAFSGGAFFTLLYRYNNGIVRGYLYLAIGAGMLLYHFGPSDPLVDGLCQGLKAIRKQYLFFLKNPIKKRIKGLQKNIKSFMINVKNGIRIRKKKRGEKAADGKRKTKKKTSETGSH